MFAKIFLLTVLTAVATAESELSWPEAIEQCAIENGFEMDMELSMADKVQGCVIACTMKRLGTMNENGHWKPEEKIALIPKEYPKYDATVAAMKECAQLIGKTDCETANLLQKCLIQKLPCEEDECEITSYLYLF